MLNKLEDYDVLDVIGTNSYGPCFKVLHKATCKHYVWKAVDYGLLSSESRKVLLSEISALSDIHHPNILLYHRYIIHKPSLTMYIIMDYCTGGDLAALIRKCQQTRSFIEESYIWKILYQVGRALQVCHTKIQPNTVLHRSIRPSNILLDVQGNAKLGDFGLLKAMEGQYNLNTVCGCYMSPELLKNGKYSRKSDIWALGCLIYELCSLTPPFIGSSWEILIANMKQYSTRIPSHYSDDLQKIINMMLSVKPEIRPPIETILFHPSIITRIASESLEHLSIDESKTFLSDSDKVSQKSDSLKSSSSSHCSKCSVIEQNLQQRDKILKSKEISLNEREAALKRREKKVTLLEALVREKLTKAELYLKKCRDSNEDDLDSSYSTDLGDTSICQPSVAKLSPSKIVRPSFLRNAPLRRTVHFESPRHLSTIYEYQNTRGSVSKFKDDRTSWLEKKRSSYHARLNEETNKENMGLKKCDNFKSSLLSLKTNTIQLQTGQMETHFI